MALPFKLKQMMLFNDGLAYVGDVTSVTLPKLVRKLDEYRSGGMNRPAKIDMGGEALEMEFVCGGPMRDVFRQYGTPGMGGVQLRFAGSYQDDDSGEVAAIEVVVRGRHEEIDMGEAKPGEGTDFKVKSSLIYYKLTWNGVTEVEIDVLGMIEMVGGIDRMAEIRGALGIF
ncbi:phage major tail tube protein [Sphingomonas sp. HMP6]|uniref:phage major tail tube protein n=1 Tax=Sphingomonas sp. HMP6 TaxID=1517551 RepID=UPI001596B7DC|nr:phage major tail tube protein [Sphingomonas sp. HMP6]BCA60232.1 hypothetical protein HMP06_3001 [Sphingomonas sp. HMP6]